MLLNDTDLMPEIDKCIRICLPNITIPSESEMPLTSTEIPYIEGATARKFFFASFKFPILKFVTKNYDIK